MTIITITLLYSDNISIVLGGTVDMTFHEVTNDQTVDQIQLEQDRDKENRETQPTTIDITDW